MRAICRAATLLCALVIFALTGTNGAAAQTGGAGATAVRDTAAAGRSVLGRRPPPAQLSAWQTALFYVRSQQQRFYRQLAKAVKQLKAEGSLAAAWTLVLLSFLYGIFHAAGPGHGKTVISAYLLANEKLVRRGVLLAFLSSLVQALSAITLVTLVVLVLQAAGREAQKMVGPMESASYALISLVGLYMLWRALAGGRAHAHVHAHAHSGESGAHGHGHGGGEAGCGHAHMPTPDQIAGPWSLGRALSIIFAVGIRPCSGAVLVLLFAKAIGIYAAGIGATFAMALGTALTVSALAILTLVSKNVALAFAGRRANWLAGLYRGLAVAGSLMVVAIGLVLLIGSWDAPRPFI